MFTELSNNNNPFECLFYRELNQSNTNNLKSKTRFLGNILVTIKDLYDATDNQLQNESYASMTSAICTAITAYSVLLANPLVTAPLALLSFTSFAFNLKAKCKKGNLERDVLGQLERYIELLDSVPPEMFATLWEVSGNELFLESLRVGMRGKSHDLFTNVASYLASCHGVSMEAFKRELTAVKSGKPTTLQPPENIHTADTVIQSPTVLQPTPRPKAAVINIPVYLAKALKLSLIVGTPGAGKGIFVSNALDAVKRIQQNVTVFYLDPKKEEREDGYFTGGRIDYPFRIDMFADPQEVYDWLKSAIAQYEAFKSNGVKLLVVDELKLILSKLSQINGKAVRWFSNKLSSYGSSGDSRGIVVWAINQSAHAIPGFDGADRSMFVPVFLIDGKNISAAQGLLSAKMLSASSKPSGEELRELCSRSPVNRAIYYGGTDQWYPMPLMENFSGYDRDSRSFLPGFTPKSVTENSGEVLKDKTTSPTSLEVVLREEDITECEDSEVLTKDFEAAKLGISRDAFLVLEKLKECKEPTEAWKLANKRPFGGESSDNPTSKVKYYLDELVSKKLALCSLKGKSKLYSAVKK